MGPKVKVNPSRLDRIVDGLSLVLLIALCLFTIYAFIKMPDTIPTHFNSAGKVDDYGDKSTILLLAFVPTVLFIGLTILNRYPHIFNYPTEITEANAGRLYMLATRLLRFMKLVIVFMFAEILLSTYFISIKAAHSLSSWFLPIEILLMVVPVAIVTIQAKRKQKHS